MPLSVLEPDRFDEFLERFSRFGDAAVEEVVLRWDRAQPFCIVTISATDTEPCRREGRTDFLRPEDIARVVLRFDDVRGFGWPGRWKGSFECAELYLLKYPDSVVATVALDGDPWPSTSDSFRDGEGAIFYVEGRSVSYEVISPHPQAGPLTAARFKWPDRATVSPSAPSHYRPASEVVIFTTRVVEDSSIDPYPAGMLLCHVKYADGKEDEIPEQWLLPASGAPSAG